MTTPSDEISRRKLINSVTPENPNGELEALLATTFDLDAEFFETDFLPAAFGMKVWSNRNWSGRIILEKKLALLESATVWMEAERYGGRPRSLRVEVVPFKRPVGKLHAKVTVFVYSDSVRLLLGSANLTERGYRQNREVAVELTASSRNPDAANLIHDALGQMEHVLQDWWTESAEKARNLALSKLRLWRIPSTARTQEWFEWSGVDASLWQRFVARWPENEQIRTITIVSPFWAENPQSNFLEHILGTLNQRGLLVSRGASLKLLTDARPVSQTTYIPVLPEAYGTVDFEALGVSASAHAVDPTVQKEEIDFRGEFVGRRALHAKVMLLEGANTALAYVGSANFTHRGWGLGIQSSYANIEAGVVLLRTGRQRAELNGIVPATIGDPVPLTGHCSAQLAKPDPMSPEKPWPLFLRSVSLDLSSEAERLELQILTWPERVDGPWTISVGKPGEDGVLIELLRVTNHLERNTLHRAPLNQEGLNALLLQQEVIVQWWGSDATAHYPVNVALAARQNLPIAPGNARLEEHHMLAYYQGKVSWEDLFPDPQEPGERQRLEELADLNAGVDTSGIQSYQIREFVEALHGIAQDMKQHCYSVPAMRLALFGPVSPVSLARSVLEATRTSKRTPVGAGFQLVEILACLDLARNFEVDEHLQMEWHATLQKAEKGVEAMLEQLVKECPGDFPLGGAFARYRQSVRVEGGISVP